jgi:hypothetical protein
MIGWQDFELKLEQHQDQLRRAEIQYQIKHSREQSSLWHTVGKLFSGKQHRDETACCQQSHFVKKPT